MGSLRLAPGLTLMALANKRVLYISYNGMLDPLGQSQVIPYLKELSKLGVRFTLLSYERAQAYTAEGEQRCRGLKEELSQFNIEWHRLRYHQRPSMPATAYDVAAGIRFASRLVKQDKIDLVHARAHIPAVIALNLKRRFGVKMIFDVRGLMVEEYVDAGHWQANGVAARLTKRTESRVLRATDGLVTLTDVLWGEMKTWPDLRTRAVVHETIPCCIDQNQFHFDAEARNARRRELNVSDRLVLVYSGSVGGWYMTDEMAAMFAALRRQRPDAFFLWLTTGPAQIVESAMRKSGIEPVDYAVRNARPCDVSSFLSASDVGIAFYRPGISRLGTSPVKVSEYLSCGLPVVINAGIGDTDRVIAQEDVGALVPDFNDDAYAKAAATVFRFVERPEQIRSHAREVAKRLFDLRVIGIERYARLYQGLLN